MNIIIKLNVGERSFHIISTMNCALCKYAIQESVVFGTVATVYDLATRVAKAGERLPRVMNGRVALAQARPNKEG